jgi:hypothetical protein
MQEAAQPTQQHWLRHAWLWHCQITQAAQRWWGWLLCIMPAQVVLLWHLLLHEVILILLLLVLADTMIIAQMRHISLGCHGVAATQYARHVALPGCHVVVGEACRLPLSQSILV